MRGKVTPGGGKVGEGEMVRGREGKTRIGQGKRERNEMGRK